MAVTAGTKVLASEYNTLRNYVNLTFADQHTTEVFGGTYQTYGWGGSSSAVVSTGDTITAAQYNRLRDMVYIGADVVNGIAVSEVPAAVSSGGDILASQYNDLQTADTTVRSNRLDIETVETSIATLGSSARSVLWGSEINAIYRFTFADFRRAKYFWNSGGSMRFYGVISGYSTGTGQDGAGFNEIFTNMGTVEMDYTKTTQTGSGGSPTSIGFYNLTTAWTTIFTQTGTGVYSNAVLQLQARRSTTGNYTEVICRLTPEAGRTVNGTTRVYCQSRKLNNQSFGTASLSITAPTYTLENVF